MQPHNMYHCVFSQITVTQALTAPAKGYMQVVHATDPLLGTHNSLSMKHFPRLSKTPSLDSTTPPLVLSAQSSCRLLPSAAAAAPTTTLIDHNISQQGCRELLVGHAYR
jgi:hypothetical protein